MPSRRYALGPSVHLAQLFRHRSVLGYAMALFWAVLLIPQDARGQLTCPGSDAIILNCNGNGMDDFCDISAGTSADADSNGIPDECEGTECISLWEGFEPVPPFAAGDSIDLVDYNGDGNAWRNFSRSWTIDHVGCPSTEGKALKGLVMEPPLPGDSVRSEFFHTDSQGRLECTAHKYRFAADFRVEGQLDPRIDWQLLIRDGTNNFNVVVLHFPSTRSIYPGVGSEQGRLLVENPDDNAAFLTLDPAHVLAADQCFRIEVELDNNAPPDSAVKVFVDGSLRLTTKRLGPSPARMDYILIWQAANGQETGGISRLAIDNVVVCESGPPLDWPDCNRDCIEDSISVAFGLTSDCNTNGTPDDCEHDCNANWNPDDCDIAGGSSEDVIGPGAAPDGVPDECQQDCNNNLAPDEADIAGGTSFDCNANARADECDVTGGTSSDCNGNAVPDECDVGEGTSPDCNSNGTPDECDVGEISRSWRPVTGSLTWRNRHAMAYDNTREVVVQFGGGTDGMGLNGETWERDGAEWVLRAISGPQPRLDHAMAYDSGRRVTVLFGGSDSTFPHQNGETWEWDGNIWSLRATTGPPPRFRHAMAYDRDREVTVLFGGGAASSTVGDTWEWDGTAWTLRATGGPSPRGAHEMTYDSARGVTVLFGGQLEAPVFWASGETWEWNGTWWALRATNGPSPRAEHALVYDGVRGVVVLFGGSVPPGYNVSDTWEWDGFTWILRENGGPAARYQHAMAYDSARGEVVLFGGRTDRPFDYQTWFLGMPSHDCNVNGVPDECTPPEADCDSDSIPDECEGAGPTFATIAGAASWKLHGNGIGPQSIPIDLNGRVELGNVTTEPRSGGISELRIAFDTAPGGPSATPVTIESQTGCPPGTQASYVPDDADYFGSIAGNELILQFTPALPNARTYKFTIGSALTCIAGQSIELRSLIGDVDSSGRVNAGDRSAVVAVWTGSNFSVETDLDGNGRTHGTDRSIVVSAWTGLEHCAP